MTQRGGLLAALVAAGGLARLQRGDQAARERQRGIRGVGLRGLLDHGGARQHVAGDREALAGRVAAPVDAGRAGMRRDAAVAIHDVDLAVVAAFVAFGQDLDDLLGRHFVLQEHQAVRAIERIDQRLRGDRADARLNERHAAADREILGGDRDAEGAGGIAGDEGPGHCIISVEASQAPC